MICVAIVDVVCDLIFVYMPDDRIWWIFAWEFIWCCLMFSWVYGKEFVVNFIRVACSVAWCSCGSDIHPFLRWATCPSWSNLKGHAFNGGLQKWHRRPGVQYTARTFSIVTRLSSKCTVIYYGLRDAKVTPCCKCSSALYGRYCTRTCMQCQLSIHRFIF